MLLKLVTAALAVAVVGARAEAQGSAAQADAIWLNPHNSIAVRTGACGDKMCAWVVWANDGAKSDARDKGTPQLVGAKLLEDCEQVSPGAWTGTVFVPDVGRRFTSKIHQLSPTRLKVSGCILGGFICRSEIWTRIERVPNA